MAKSNLKEVNKKIEKGAAVGSIAEGFVMAKKAVKDIFEKTESADIVSEVKDVVLETVE